MLVRNRYSRVNLQHHPLAFPAATRENTSRWPVYTTGLAMTWLLIGPRVNLVTVNGSSIRLEDLILLSLVPVAFAGWRGTTSFRVRGIGLVTGAAVGASCVGVALGHVHLAATTLYAVRPLEYWVAYPTLLACLVRPGQEFRRTILRILAIITVAQSTTAFGQVLLGVAIGFSKFSYQRGAGLTAGPYELGAICAALACFWLARRQYVLTAIACGGLVLSASRISLVAFALAAAYLVVGQLRNRRRDRAMRAPGAVAELPSLHVPVVCGLLAILIATLTIWYPSVAASSVGRIQRSSAVAEWAVAGQAAAGIPPATRSDDYQEVAYVGYGEAVGEGLDATQDASSLIRFFRWHLLLKSLRASWIFGLGPSFAGPSVDGAALRILVETGVVGICSWLYMLTGLLRRKPRWAQAVIFTFVIGGLFIDIPFAMRPMILMWTLVAIADAGASQWCSATATAAERRQSTTGVRVGRNH